MNLLWQKDSNGLYANIFERISSNTFDLFSKNLSITTAKFAVLKLHQKNDKLSSDYRKDGNRKFKANDYLDAMSSYNKSLCYAEIGSENVSLCFANRSACFLHLAMYNECIIDIELAKQANYPAKMMSKLDERRDNCLRLMDAEKNMNELSYEADDKFPGMANVLDIRYDEKYGRHIVAKCNIPAGKTVLAEKAFVERFLNTSYNGCTVCMRVSRNFVACTKCTTALFCNNGCTNVTDMHPIDCPELPPTREGDPLEYYLGTLIFILRLFPSVDRLIEFVENAIENGKGEVPHSLGNVKSKFRALLQFSWNSCPTKEKSQERLNEAYMIYHRLLLRKSIKKLFETEKKKRFLMHLVLHLNCVMINNTFDAGNGLQMALYIVSSYVNHSCAPNVLGLNTHKSVRYCRTVRPIPAGEQLFASYIGDLSAEPGTNFINEVDSDHRQKMLHENYGFQCKCERCEPNMKLWEMNSWDMRLDRFFQWFHTNCDHFMNDDVGEKEKKVAMVEKKMVDLLNRFGGEHWCDELASIIASYENLFINFPLELSK